MKNTFFLLFLGTASLLSAHQAQIDQAQINQENPGYRKMDQGSNQDMEIVKQVQDVLSSAPFSQGHHNVSFEVNNGIVTLTGSVKTQDDKNKVEERVKNIAGVKQVVSQISANGQGAPVDAKMEKGGR